MRRMLTLSLGVVTAAMLSGCAAGNMKTVWREPATGAPLKKVAVFAAAQDEGVRRSAEDAFVASFAMGGASATQAVASYKALPADMPADSVQVINQLRAQGVDGALVLRYLGKDKDVMATGGYGGYGGWYGHYGYGMAYDAPMVTTTTTYYLSATLYTLEPPKLMWSGRGDTFNPSSVNQLIGELANATVSEMRMQKVVQ